MAQNDELDKLKEDLARVDQEAQQVTNVNILFLDISSTCTGYAIGSVDFTTKKAEIKKAGALWLGTDWAHAQKYDYLASCMQNYFDIIERIDHVVVEAYSVNPKKMVGVNVVSEMQGALKSAFWNCGTKVSSILPQTWRAALGIKPIITADKKGKKVRNYKTPTEQLVLKDFAVPENSISNITAKERTTPSDLYDAVAIALGWLNKYGFKVVNQNKCEFNTHIGVPLA